MPPQDDYGDYQPVIFVANSANWMASEGDQATGTDDDRMISEGDRAGRVMISEGDQVS